MLPTNPDRAPAAAPWLCILPTGPVSSQVSALLYPCFAWRRGLQHNVSLFPAPRARSALSGPQRRRRGTRAATQCRTARCHRTVPVKGGGRGLGKGGWERVLGCGLGKGALRRGDEAAAAGENIFTLTLVDTRTRLQSSHGIYGAIWSFVTVLFGYCFSQMDSAPGNNNHFVQRLGS
jgi:hypothetical protein